MRWKRTRQEEELEQNTSNPTFLNTFPFWPKWSTKQKLAPNMTKTGISPTTLIYNAIFSFLLTALFITLLSLVCYHHSSAASDCWIQACSDLLLAYTLCSKCYKPTVQTWVYYIGNHTLSLLHSLIARMSAVNVRISLLHVCKYDMILHLWITSSFPLNSSRGYTRGWQCITTPCTTPNYFHTWLSFLYYVLDHAWPQSTM